MGTRVISRRTERDADGREWRVSVLAPEGRAAWVPSPTAYGAMRRTAARSPRRDTVPQRWDGRRWVRTPYAPADIGPVLGDGYAKLAAARARSAAWRY